MRDDSKLEGKVNSKNKVGGDVIAARIKLHQAITGKMKSIGLCTSPKVVEIFKRWYLWDYWNVETSRSLSLLQLKDAMKMLEVITQASAVSMLMAKYNAFETQREILKLTSGQKNKIIAIAKYKFELSHKDLKDYAKKRLHRDPYINQYFTMDITIDEADQLIKALEKWEIKASTSLSHQSKKKVS